MKNPFRPGDTQTYLTSVTPDKLAAFAEGGLVHPVYSTFAVARDAEWACRLFVLQMKEAGEEGVGSYVSVHHVSPAPLGCQVQVVATLERVEKNRVWCKWQALSGDRLLAHGEQEQHIVNKDKFDALLHTLGPSA
jgi:predicted thioesterase